MRRRNAAPENFSHDCICKSCFSHYPELAKDRVKFRVQEGGHNIPPDTIERRYFMGLDYLFRYYLPVVDKSVIYDNSHDTPILIAKQLSDKIQINNEIFYNRLTDYAKNNR